ncbi:putative NAD(P)H nitroreductase YdjA [compost metagenome]|uniref:nitroreductase family protein n=1 Tax=unclassified Pseudomonas TaxID=196821 RepID=UPI000FA77C6E|nr:MULTISPECIES: nitroreductase family protein [unclassified Pseudomonas]
MNILNTMLQRKTYNGSAGEVAEADLRMILECALAAPDHKRMRRTHYLVCQPEKKATLAEHILHATYGNDYSPEQAQGVMKKLSFAPLIIIVSIDCSPQDRVPYDELILAAGAGIQNLIIAAEALDYQTSWKTGAWAYNAQVHERLGLLGSSKIAGIIGVGRGEATNEALPPTDRPSFADNLRLLT